MSLPPRRQTMPEERASTEGADTPSSIPSDVERGTIQKDGHFLDDRSTLFKAAFILVACSTQLMSTAQLGMVVIPLPDIGDWLGTANAGELSWMSASYGMTVGMFLIQSGRIGDLLYACARAPLAS